MLNEMSNDFQKALKINKYVWDKWVWLSSTPWRDTNDFFFFSAGLSCHLKSNKIHGFDHCSAAQSPGKGTFPQKEIGMSQRWTSLTAALAGLILAQLCLSRGLCATAEGGAPVKDPDYLLHVPGISVTLLGW